MGPLLLHEETKVPKENFLCLADAKLDNISLTGVQGNFNQIIAEG